MAEIVPELQNSFEALGDQSVSYKMHDETRTRDAHVQAILNGKKKIKEPIIWIDLEMTGLDLTKDFIMEIAVIITDGSLNISIEGPNICVHLSDESLDTMNEWCTEHHGASGLTERCRNSQITMQVAEEMILRFIQTYTQANMCPLGGNTVLYDRRFLEKDMPMVANHIHYRTVDVSSVKEICKRWYPGGILCKYSNDVCQFRRFFEGTQKGVSTHGSIGYKRINSRTSVLPEDYFQTEKVVLQCNLISCSQWCIFEMWVVV